MNRYAATFIFALSLVSSDIHAQDCWTTRILSTTPTPRFIDNQNGTITDAFTGLMWQKCTFGQSYNADTGDCLGNPNVYSSWSSALNAAKSNPSAFGYTGFRLPNIKELGSIVERQCVDPAINLSVFPQTPSRPYLSNSLSVEDPDSFPARYINFENGTEYTPFVKFTPYIRLVRDITDEPL
jgi:hypothetical protein